MKITSMELFPIPPRWLFLRIGTDEEIVGWGEPVVEGRTASVAAAVKELEPFLIGRDPGEIEDIWQVLYRGFFYRGGPAFMSAIAGIDQALWDIAGKRLGVPVYRLLGGPVRQKVRVYSWIGGDRPHQVAEQARQRIAEGFTAVKMNASEEMDYIDSPAKIDAVIARAAAVREAIGNDRNMGIDFHGRIHRSVAKVLLRELEPFHPMFVEEPVLPEHMESLRTLAETTTIPIALGERLFSRWDFKPWFASGAVDIVQPDLSHAGGISEVRRIAAMAEAYDIAVAPHCPLGPIALAASLQIDAAAPNAVIQEISLGIHYNDTADLQDYLRNSELLKLQDGFVDLPTASGLGVEIDEEKVRESSGFTTWHNPIWRNADGSIAEW
ncbi:MAG: galactonate dehydratase [Firmicutes bacterium]|nr:galactonate dehydratase [Bacillota bacterium]